MVKKLKSLFMWIVVFPVFMILVVPYFLWAGSVMILDGWKEVIDVFKDKYSLRS